MSVRLQLRWADTDAYGHVNNVTWVRYLEEARIRLFGLPDSPSTASAETPPILSRLDPGSFTITASQHLSYVNELAYHGQFVVVHAWLSRIGSTSVEMSFRVTDESGDTIYLLADTIQAFREISTRAAHRFTDREREVLERFVAAPNTYR